MGYELRVDQQLSALNALARSDRLRAGDVEGTLRQAAKVAAQALQVGRVSIWRFTPDRSALTCLELYDLATDCHSSGMELPLAHAPLYFQALLTTELIAADDVRTDSRTQELWEPYMKPLGIRSMMDAPVYVAGHVEGVLCHEHTGLLRQWKADEKLFAVATANLVSQVLEQIERQRAEEELGESQRTYQSLVDSIDGIVWEMNVPEFRFTFVSKRAEAILGYPPDRWLKDLTWQDLIHPDDLDYVLSLCTRAIEEKRNHEIEYRVLAADGRVEWVRHIATVIVEQDHPVAVRGVLLDITERKNLELQFHQSQKMEAIGRLAGGIAHDFNNLLTVITGYSQLLLDRISHDDANRNDLDEIKRAGRRATILTQQLLAFSRRQVLMPKVLDLNGIISGMDQMLQRLIGVDVHLVTILESGLWAVKADPGQVEQVLMNLVVNARDAMPQGGKVTIETSNLEVREPYRHGEVTVIKGSYVQVLVRDTGIGMDAETQTRVFDPFFTTKEKGKGTGLGLSTVYGIVKQSDGYIFLSSEPNRGSTFQILLPRVQADVDAVDSHKETPTLPGGSETILLVDDEPGVRSFVQDTLQLHGYTVLQARHGIEALLVGSQHSGPIHLLLVDVVMPQMSGREVVSSLSPARPDMKVLYMSGYADDAMLHLGVLDAGMPFLQKPFLPDALIRKVRLVLDGEVP